MAASWGHASYDSHHFFRKAWRWLDNISPSSFSGTLSNRLLRWQQVDLKLFVMWSNLEFKASMFSIFVTEKKHSMLGWQYTLKKRENKPLKCNNGITSNRAVVSMESQSEYSWRRFIATDMKVRLIGLMQALNQILVTALSQGMKWLITYGRTLPGKELWDGMITDSL